MSVQEPGRWADLPSERLTALYEKHDGNITRIAEDLGCSWSRASQLLQRHGLHERESRPCDTLAELEPGEVPGLSGGER